jgi:hypothetical protein
MLRELDGESVLLNLDNGRYYGLDEVGTRLYALLTAAETAEAALAAALAEYEVDEATLRADITALVERLVDEGLIEHADGEPGA